MSIVFRLRAEDLLQCRFAISPLNETADALRSLTQRGGEGYHLPWQRQVRERLPDLRIEPLLTLLSLRGYQPDFISPAPSGPFTEIDAELERVRATRPARVAAELAQCLDRHPARRPACRDHPELSGDPAQTRDLLADMLHRAWSALVEPSSTTGLAARCGVPVSSVSEHLAVLRATGLVSTSRTGRFLLHQRTALGIALSAGS